MSRSIPQPDFSGSQEGWIGEVGDQPETPEPVHPPNPFQDGEPGNDPRPTERGRLDGLNRLKGRLPISHNMGGPQKVFEISMERQSVRVPIPSVWPEQCTTCIHQIIEARPCKISSSGNETDIVFGRYVGDGTEQGETREPSSSLLELLGFVVNREKSQLTPTQVTHYLGFIVDSKEMKIRLLEEKVTQISTACRRIRKKRCASVRELARLIGKMTATLPAVFPAPLWYRELQRLKNQTYQRSQSFECMVTLSQEALLELDWWSVERNLMNGKSVITQDPDLTMETDASMLGWGAVCQGIRTGGFWSQAERRSHINYLELLAAWFGVRAFARDKRNIHIHLKMDNSTAVFYVNRMGGTRSPVLSNLAIQLWQWCLERNLSITAEHLPGVDNVVADEESRVIQSTAEWQLHRPIFQQILECLGNCNIDLFATRLNAQLKQFVSWRPDPDSMGADALQLPWNTWEGYAFPPFCLIGKCVKKVREDRASLILIAPVWRSQPWFPALLELLVDFPLILPRLPMLLSDPLGKPHPLMATGQLQLAAWKLSGIDNRQRAFQAKLRNCWQQDGAGAQTLHMNVLGGDGIAGALNGKLIPFHVLSSHS